MQKTVTLVWELGGGLGHLYRLSTFGSALHKRGYKIGYVIPSQFINPLAVMEAEADFILPVPYEHTPDPFAYGDAVNYSEILSHFSYANTEQFNVLAQQWHEVLTRHKTDLIISDYSPSSVFIARCLNIPSIMVGSGFSCPAIDEPMPIFINRQHETFSQRVQKVESLVLESLNNVAMKYKQQTLNSVSELFSGVVQTWLCTQKNLDHYPQRKFSANQEYLGPIGNDSSSSDKENNIEKEFPGKKKQASHKVLVYLNGDYPRIKNILAQLSDLDANVVCYCPRLDRYIIDHYENLNFRFAKKAIDLNSCLPQVDLVVHHGGINLSNLAMMYGKPQCLFPVYQEQQITAENLQNQKLGWLIEPDSANRTIKKIVRSEIADTEMQRNLMAKKSENVSYNESLSISKFTEKIDQILS